MTLVIGVDSSTQSTKVELRRADTGELCWHGANPHPPTTPPRSEQHPDAWWEALRPLLDRATSAAGGERVGGLAVAAQQHGMVVLDGQRRVLRPAKLWNDTESAPDASILVDRLGGPSACAAACGSVIGPAFTASKVAWLRRCEPGVHARVAHVLLPHDWLTFRISGELVTDRGDASGTGYYTPAVGTWAARVLELLELSPSSLPRLAGPMEAVPGPGGVVVGPGTGDNMAAALGVGLRPGDLAVSIGTSGTVFTPSSRPTADASGAVAGFADATGGFLPLVCTLNATKVTDAVARLLGLNHEAFDRLALGAPPGAGGLTFLPYLDGERTPDLPYATGTLSGIRSDVTPAQVARAAVEGVVCGLAEGLDHLVAAGAFSGAGDRRSRPARVVLLGGGARSAAYRQVVADLFGLPVSVAPSPEPVATGACVQAAAVLEGTQPAEVADQWRLRTEVVAEPLPGTGTEAGAVRRAYRELRHRMSAG